MSLRPDLATCWYRLCGVVHRHGMGRILLATAGYDHTIRLWEAATAASSRTLQFADSHANCLEFSPDGRHLAVGGNPNVVLFDVSSANLNPFYVFDAHRGNAVSVKFERDGNWICSGSDDGFLRTWDPRAPGAQRKFENKAPISAVCLRADQRRILTADYDGRVRQWDVAQGFMDEFAPIARGSPALLSMALAPGDKHLTAGNKKGNVFLWNLEGEKTLERSLSTTLQIHDRYILKVQLSPNGKKFAIALDSGAVEIWSVDVDLSSGSPSQLHTLHGHMMWVWDCVFTPDSKFLFTGSSDMKVLLWELESDDGPAVLRRYIGHEKAVSSLALTEFPQ
mmetsp:Transcript_11335/g.22936  ORF Transcript_11335/g.22936 Transcript_11335/m.22936 type:complete len:337 (-) Transcript_11335:1471-2481(-)